MSFISYAQNYEDVMLWRALKHIEHGFYIDVGAAWPEQDSVTKAFYDRGWSGVNVEPNPEHYCALELNRPNDINVQAALGEVTGKLNLSLFRDTGLSTLDAEIAKKHISQGYTCDVINVPLVTLKDLFLQYDIKDVHFLKIDVEGFEKQVISGNDWSACRPWIIVVEATVPMSQIEYYTSWEPILINNDYVFAYADGLNRFYVAKEHIELVSAIKYPPNVFDQFITANQFNLQQDLIQANEQAESAQEQARNAQMQVGNLQEQVINAQEQLVSLQKQVISLQVQARVAQEQTREAQEQLISEQVQARVAQEQTREAQEQLISEQAQARVAQEQKREAQEQLISEQERVRESQACAEEFRQRLLAVYASTSWRITRPLRLAKRLIIGDVETWRILFFIPKQIFMTFIKQVLRKVIYYIDGRPILAYRLKRFVCRFPRLKSYLLRLIHDSPLNSDYVTDSSYIEVESDNLPCHAQGIYRQMKSMSNRENQG
ncbi:FkbM family methyltransferase [Aeromonas veronii]|uniref:FkbM family methyltransferase n=1 Tax=Aeromonas veronii TaxID=654 RepID=UPI00188D5825|nr:FkbM family methyltransferase [Aeromonas veronii]MBF3237306.1 FkbM family methyltransferase [Aeromonas veronii]